MIGASGKEIVWTSGATESDNLAIKGAAEFLQDRGNHIITAQTEHKAVLDTCKRLEKEGFAVTYLPVEKDGRVDPAAVRAAMTDKTILVSIMLANNEIGTVNPVEEIGAVVKEKGALFHIDAVQGVGKIPFDVNAARADLVSLSAHKMYGPKGVGALYVRRKPRVRITAIIDGGGHERGMRSGTLNVPGIVGFGAAAELCRLEMPEESKRTLALRERLRKGITERVGDTYLNGSLEHRLPGNLNISFAYVEGEAMLMALKDVAVSSGSACTSASLEPSYVLRAVGVGEELAHTSIRFGIGRFNTEEEVDLRDRPRRQQGRQAARAVTALRDGQGRHRPQERDLGSSLIGFRIRIRKGTVKWHTAKRSWSITRTRATSAASPRTIPTSGPAWSARLHAAT